MNNVRDEKQSLQDLTSGRETTISAYFITKNEENTLGRAIESVRWMNEIIVLDSGSTDKTVEIAERLGAKVSYAPFNSFHEQKSRAMKLCTGDWTINIDADEEVTPELRLSIEQVLTTGDSPGKPYIYKICRKNNYLGRWIKHCGWYPEYRTRLAKTGHAHWEAVPFPERLAGDGPVGVLSGDLLHRPYADLGAHLKSIDRYTSMWAHSEAESGRTTGLLNLLLRPAAKFIKMYLIRGGFLDLGPGLIASLMGAWYTFMKYARLYELSRGSK
ncbi:glycosyltransferase family 2 protein [Candidatus Omnitrophota bacterium]